MRAITYKPGHVLSSNVANHSKYSQRTALHGGAPPPVHSHRISHAAIIVTTAAHCMMVHHVVHSCRISHMALIDMTTAYVHHAYITITNLHGTH
eukprot:TRINITY_DN5646_c0_g1_i1.p1 TRINITY_DN5646_c0_g1~~TRINITY_DN5646_c0_g1_i1.p1  ORF type:complete len:101 (-),score=5.13 TRINITY_DN5646_c0_g1_i1:116-397(-)